MWIFLIKHKSRLHSKIININYLTIKGVMLFTVKRENDAKASMWEKEKGDDLNQNDR